jgi:hypothetical protein
MDPPDSPVKVFEALRDPNSGPIAPLLAEDVVFESPVRTYSGREQAAVLLEVIRTVVADVAPSRVVRGDDEVVTFFTARVAGGDVDGVLSERAGPDGLAGGITLMLRPLKGLLLAVEAMTRALADL